MPLRLLASEVLDLRRSGDLAALPNIPTASLNDKSKDDIFIKLVAIFQVFWFVLQVIVRAAKGLNTNLSTRDCRHCLRRLFHRHILLLDLAQRGTKSPSP